MKHAEAFKIMTYTCKSCSFPERIWNSRDGVTPFAVGCLYCGEDALHSEWKRDEFRPDYDPQVGDRYFRDGIPEEARAIMRSRLERGRGTPYEIPEKDWPAFIDHAVVGDPMDIYGTGELVPVGEFQPGWPMLVVRGTDADTLPPRSLR